MTEIAGAAPAPAADGAQPPAGTGTAAPAAAAGDPTPDPAAEPMTLAEARELRRENQTLRSRVKAAEEADKAKADAELSEVAKRDKRIAELEAENATAKAGLRQAAIADAITAAARRAGFWDPELATALVASDDVKFGEDGRPTNADALVAAIAKAKPRLVNGAAPAGASGLGPQGSPAGAAPDMNAIIRGATGRQ